MDWYGKLLVGNVLYYARRPGVSQRSRVSIQQQAISGDAGGERDQGQHEQGGMPV